MQQGQYRGGGGRGGGGQRGSGGGGRDQRGGGRGGGGYGRGGPSRQQPREEEYKYPTGTGQPTSPQQPQISPPRFDRSGGSKQPQMSPKFEMREEQAYKCPPPMPPATQMQQRDGLSSIYTIKVQPGKKAYRYDVDIERLPMPKRNGELDKGRSLVKGADDGQKALNRNLCFELVTIAYQMTDGFGMPNGNELVYDCKAIMFTSCPIRDIGVITIENENVNNYVKTYCGEGRDVRFSISITPNAMVPELDLNDFGQYRRGESVFNEDRSLRTFFEMATTQYALNNELFTAVAPGKLYVDPKQIQGQKLEDVGNGMHLRHGLAKGVKVIKNDNGNGNGAAGPRAAVVLDTKVSAFFIPQKLIYTVLDILQPRNNQPKMGDFPEHVWRSTEKTLEDLRVEVNYRKTRTFELGKFTDKPIRDLYLDMDMPGGRKEKVSVPEYFRRKYNIELKFPGLPGIKPNNPVPADKQVEVFPLEVLTIMEDQRVPLSKTSADLNNKLLNANSMLPEQRMHQISRRANELGLFHDDNPVLRAFGISIDQKSNRCVIGIRPLPKIRFQNRVVNPDPVKGEWRRDGARLPYLETSQLKNWRVLCSQRELSLVGQFIKFLIQMAGEKGLSISQPAIMAFSCSETNVNDWVSKFEQFAEEGVQFVMMVDPKRQETHGLLKLFEVMFKPMITQHVTLEKARDVIEKRQRQTCENIINKMNMKNFGLNYEPLIEQCAQKYGLEKGNVLVIGYDVSHPAPMSAYERRKFAAKGEKELKSLEPSVVGICANMASNPHAFVGDYFCQESRREALDLAQLRDRMKWILTNLEQNRPDQSRPKNIFIFRDGLSEGQFAMACKDELEAIRMGTQQFDPKYKPKFAMIVGTKRHFKKFFTDDGFENGHPKVGNLVPGSVIDRKVVRADLSEFYIQPHAPLKGTGKQVEYSVLENEICASSDEIQGLLMSLCYSHQIVNIATSLPEPVYQADELAKRGRNNFLALKKFYPGEVPLGQNRVVDNTILNSKLCYWDNGGTSISHRFTA